MLADYQDVTEQVNNIIYYYPISPQLAITINDNNTDDAIVLLYKEEADEYNKALIAASYECVFANCEGIFEQYFLFPQ